MANLTLDAYLDKNGVDSALKTLLSTSAIAAQEIAHIVSRGELSGAMGVSAAASTNVHDEVQKALDLIANDILLDHLEDKGCLAGSASEEMETIRELPDGLDRGPMLFIFDPLDGSSNIDVNVSIGTIFSVLEKSDASGELTTGDFLIPGTNQIAAGYFVYGPATQLVMSIGSGTHAFTFDRDSSEFILTHENMQIPKATQEFAINMAYERHWHAPVRSYVDDCRAGEEGPRGKNFNMRWIASLVAEVHRILNRGGVFIYPADKRKGREAGHLRLLYEANPMAMLIEQAGGLATNGLNNITSLEPQELHQRTPLVLGSSEEVENIQARFRQA
ncbi:MAG: class 1 fructose-bisphosphatase [Granulosicoccus sp.]